MKFFLSAAILLALTQELSAQFRDTAMTAGPKLSLIGKRLVPDNPPDPPAPAPLKDAYGDLLNDDPLYNHRSDYIVPIYKVAMQNVELFLVDRYIFNYDFSHVGIQSIAKNFRDGFSFDDRDRFGIDFWGHPYTGSGYFNAGRTVGYSFYECLPLTIFGSVMWKYFGETDRPSYVDVINTSVTGMLGGEILYRLSSNLLDDRTTGAERFFREGVAAILDPSRFTSRLFQGKLTSTPDHEVYQKESLNTTVYCGGHLINDNNSFGSGSGGEILGLQFEYGNPFEVRDRKPFDVFKLRTEFNFGVGRKVLDEITAYGNLFGGSSSSTVLFTGFQMLDYWDNHRFELGSIGLGPGIIARPISGSTSLFTTLHLGWVPFAGNSPYGEVSDTTTSRDYNYCGGAEGNLEAILDFDNIVKASVRANYYWMHAYFIHDNNFIGILTPKITVNILPDLGIGLEHIIYYTDDYPGGANAISRHSVHTEQKFFIQYYFENSRRGGRFN